MSYISVDNLSKTIRRTKILDDVSFRADQGATVGLSGINGSGKTMILRAVAGLIRPSSGTIAVDGAVIGKDRPFPERVGILIENPAFLSLRTGHSNLELLAKLSGHADAQDIEYVLESVGLDPHDKRLYRKYSLGMKQRLGLAAAFMGKPRLLLLDEPTNALDESGIELFLALLERHKNDGGTTLVACHDKAILREISDEIHYLRDGRIVDSEVLR